MANISSKYLHFAAVESLLEAEKSNPELFHDGILLLTNFGIACGKLKSINPNNESNNVSELLLNTRKLITDHYIEQGDTLINDGSVVVLEDAIVKYANNITLNMKEIIIFCDHVVGFYPIDLKTFDSLYQR